MFRRGRQRGVHRVSGVRCWRCQNLTRSPWDIFGPVDDDCMLARLGVKLDADDTDISSLSVLKDHPGRDVPAVKRSAKGTPGN